MHLSANQSITRRLTVSLVVTVLVVSVIAVSAMFVVISRDAGEALERKANGTIAYLAGTLDVPLWSFDDNAVKTIGVAVSNDESIVRLIIRRESGAVSYSRVKEQGGDLTSRSARIFHKEGNREELVGEVSVSLTNEIQKANNRQLLFFLTLIIFVILISVALVTVVSIRTSLSKPLTALNKIASRFASGRYDTAGQTLPYLEFQPFGNTLVQMARTIEGQIETIRVTEGKYRNLFENALEGIFQSAVEGRFLSANPALARILGYESADDLLARAGDIADELYVDHAQRGELLSLLLDRGAVTSYETQLRRKDGQAIWVSISARMVRDETGTPLFIEGFLTCISERKRAEDALRLSSERLQLATRVANIGIWDWDIPRNELVWDDSMYQLYGIQREDFGGAYDAWARTIHPEDKARTEGEIQAALRGEREYAPEFRIVRTDGAIRHIKAESRTTRDPEGKPLRMIGTNIDISERKQAEEKIRQLNQQLEERVADRTAQLEAANKELEAFSYSVSHDLRTPLRAIDGFSHILLEDYEDKLDAEGKRLLNVVRDNTNRMGQLIDDILKFSRAGRLELNFVEIDMAQLAREAYAELQHSVAADKRQLEIDALPPAQGDRAMMRQVFANLLSNAIKFSSPKEMPEIRVGSFIEGDEAVYFVRDNGIGFDMQYADKLFGVFQRLHFVTEFEGTGIGLAIVKRVVTRHGGRVWAEGKVNEGATIYFALPRRENNHG